MASAIIVTALAPNATRAFSNSLSILTKSAGNNLYPAFGLVRKRTPAIFVVSASTTSQTSELIDAEGDVIPESDSSIYAQEAEALAQIKSPFLQTLRDRGFLHQCTNLKELDDRLCKSVNNPEENGLVGAYLGFDATADSLHVGSLLQIMILRHFQRCGHKPFVLIGGGTSKVGDPTGKDESRKLLTDEVIGHNKAGISKVFNKFLSFEEAPDIKSTNAYMVDNDTWLSELKYLEFLRDYGTQFTINRMLSFESVKQRLTREAPFSFLEFNYMILQAYDFLELYRRHGITLQMGGADQWGNIVSGIELGRRCEGASLIGLTAPLITTSDGKKMGKTEGGATWLNADKLSPYDYWQFWRNTADADVIRFMKLFTEIPLEQIAEYENLEGAEINEAKIVLADSATAMLHGEDCLPEIRETIKSMFSGGGQSIDSLPRIVLSASDVEGLGKKVVDLIVDFGFASSKKEARRLISGGGARLGEEKITEELASLTAANFSKSNEVVLRAGKKRAGVVELK